MQLTSNNDTEQIWLEIKVICRKGFEILKVNMMRKDKDIKGIRVKLIGQRQATISMIVGSPKHTGSKNGQEKILRYEIQKSFP